MKIEFRITIVRQTLCTCRYILSLLIPVLEYSFKLIFLSLILTLNMPSAVDVQKILRVSLVKPLPTLTCRNSLTDAESKKFYFGFLIRERMKRSVKA